MYSMQILILALISTAYGQILMEGQCDETLEVVRDFDVTGYGGVWYQIYRYTQVNEAGLECVTANYTLNGASVIVDNKGVKDNKIFGIIGSATQAANTTDAKLEVNFPGNTTNSPYWVIDTDYTSYSLVYSCRSSTNNTKYVTSWILSREPYLNATNAVIVNGHVEKIPDLNWTNYQTTIQWGETCEIAGSSANRAFALLLVLSAFITKFL